MPPIRPLALAALLVLASALSWHAFAQEATPPSIEQQMTPEQFKAAGLNKLSPEELANLNAWLNQTVDIKSARAAKQAAKQAEERVKDENRGFLNFGSEEAIVAHIKGAFEGFARDRIYVLDNGQVWQQTDNARLEGVSLDNPEVKIRPRIFGNTWQMTVGGYNTRAEVKRIK